MVSALLATRFHGSNVRRRDAWKAECEKGTTGEEAWTKYVTKLLEVCVPLYTRSIHGIPRS